MLTVGSSGTANQSCCVFPLLHRLSDVLRWSGLDRAERYRRRMASQAPALQNDSASRGTPDADSPLPNTLDPITLQVCTSIA